jgi:hypothetical protein
MCIREKITQVIQYQKSLEMENFQYSKFKFFKFLFFSYAHSPQFILIYVGILFIL